MISETLVTTVSFALTAGIATFFSPCAYPLLPGYVGFYVNATDDDSASVTGAGVRGVAAALGVLATFALLGGQRHGSATRHYQISPSSRRWLGDYSSSSDCLSQLTASVAVVITPKAPIKRSRLRSFWRGIRTSWCRVRRASLPCSRSPVYHPLDRGSDHRIRSLRRCRRCVDGCNNRRTGVGIISNANRVMAHTGWVKRLAGVMMIVAGIGQLYLSLIVY